MAVSQGWRDIEAPTRHPNPDNNDIITYIDEASNCYKYEIEKLECPVDQTQINDLPIN